MKGSRAFTLAELLIALAILGVIATFTIPKVLSSQQISQKNALAKEYAGMISQAYQLYKNDQGGNISNMYAKSLTPYLNYVNVVTDWSMIDNNPGNTYVMCDVSAPCLKMGNGSMLYFDGSAHFPGSATTDAMLFHFDPDGQYSGLTQGVGKGVVLVLYANGRITSYEKMTNNTCVQIWGCLSPNAGNDPSWMSW